jgi:hypothetical protein
MNLSINFESLNVKRSKWIAELVFGNTSVSYTKSKGGDQWITPSASPSILGRKNGEGGEGRR